MNQIAIARICWKLGEEREARVLSRDAHQTTVTLTLGGVPCIWHFSTETGVQLLENRQPDPEAKVWLKLGHSPASES
ncbi:hypothetical protein PN462_09450 [Spirulina sp. CS-785/01]|uniref:hypothetical protein n=1 Tax=Spirulina sp. CS-785/01 TaxID=3021716 RepID=UPI00232BE88E|nr:hypothetical protein [Spirulina sp. CS-785/01]MDB9313323.1 hypothetical protein [Spirulina sp. CS-785/01]